MRQSVILWLVLACAIFYPSVGVASDFGDKVSAMAKVDGARVYTNGDSKVRVVIDASKNVSYKTFVLSNPTRIAVDVKGAWLSPLVPKETPVQGGLVGKVRISQFSADTVRIVVEANVSKDRYKVFSLEANPGAKKSERIVMDFGDLAQEEVSKNISNEEALAPSTSTEFPEPKEIRYFDTPGLKNKKIVIDPGHGGSDGGAVGPGGAFEKNVTFSIAMELKSLLEGAGAKVVMTRSTDVDVAWANASATDELQARVNIANKEKADVFVSIHMDAFVNQQAKGTSTYIYPKTSGDARIGQFILEELTGQLKTDSRGTRKCNFYVVKHTQMPGTLVEVAFISNVAEERLLVSKTGVQSAAKGIYRGLDRYFSYE